MQGGAGVAVKGIEVAAVINPIGPLTSATIVYTQWNSRVICSLVGAAVTELLRNGVNEKDIQLLQVRPASHPLAFFCSPRGPLLCFFPSLTALFPQRLEADHYTFPVVLMEYSLPTPSQPPSYRCLGSWVL